MAIILFTCSLPFWDNRMSLQRQTPIFLSEDAGHIKLPD
ncbi:hypothetical protein ECAD30_45700 [Escherichia coli AD30]|nr:hypothetical protein ECAD30_45700 [Escherichia coli AD30]